MLVFIFIAENCFLEYRKNFFHRNIQLEAVLLGILDRLMLIAADSRRRRFSPRHFITFVPLFYFFSIEDLITKSLLQSKSRKKAKKIFNYSVSIKKLFRKSY